MSETKGFFRRIFSFRSDPEIARVPEGGDTPRSSDTEVGVTGAPDPDLHQPAAASTEADSEAGASADEPAGGGITPLTAKGSSPSSETAEKKTLP